jgi:large subunit ribosomal protein L16
MYPFFVDKNTESNSTQYYMFKPLRSKYKKQQKGRKLQKIFESISICNLKHGTIGLKSVETGRIQSNQLLAAFKSIRKQIKKVGRVTLKAFPHASLTRKPLEVRMGKGKGSTALWVVKVSAGMVLFEIETIMLQKASYGLLQAKIRLPLKTKIFFEI